MATTVAFDPGSLGLDRDPYEQLAGLRSAGPVVRAESGAWCVTGYDAVVEVLRHPSAVSGPIAGFYLAALPPGAARDEMSHRINFLDPPDHPRVRGIVNKAFTPRRVNDLRPFAERTAGALLDNLPTAEPVDLLHDYAHQLPSLVISEMLGVPTGDRDRLTELSDAVAALLAIAVSAADREAAIEASEELADYLSALVDDRRKQPRDDLLTALMQAEDEGERLSRQELLSLAATLYSAGHRTTRDLFCNGLVALLQHPEGIDAVRDGSLPAGAVVSEFLRFETPTLYVGRVAAEPFTVAGAQIEAGEYLLLYLAAANRDPATFEHPDTFIPSRYVDGAAPTPLSFAFGAHYCLGASLAKMEAEVMLTALLERVPDPVLYGGSVEWRQRGPFRGVRALQVTNRT